MIIIDKINNNTLLYDLPRILDICDIYNKHNIILFKIKQYAKKWIYINEKSKKLDISDHKHVTTEINFKK